MAGVFLTVMVTFGTTLGREILINPKANPDPQLFLKNWPVLLIGFVVLMLFASLMGLAINKVIYSEGEGKPNTLKEALSYSLSHFMFYFLISLVVGILVLVGFILLLIPGIYALIVLSLVPVVFVLEDKHSFDAIVRSRELVKGYFWPVLGRMAVLLLIAILISWISDMVQINRVQILSLVLNFIYGIISVAYVYYIYKDLVAIKK
jgi:hypothetical protein